MANYRNKAFREYEHRCDECGFEPIKGVNFSKSSGLHILNYDQLTVHHRDENSRNNEVSNLQILCKFCHKLKHTKKESEIIKLRGSIKRRKKHIKEILDKNLHLRVKK